MEEYEIGPNEKHMTQTTRYVSKFNVIMVVVNPSESFHSKERGKLPSQSEGESVAKEVNEEAGPKNEESKEGCKKSSEETPNKSNIESTPPRGSNIIW